MAVSYGRAGDGQRLGFPGLAEFVVREGGREVLCRPDRATPASTLRHLLLDQVLPRVLSLRGDLVLHAGCVVTESGACAFVGPSGAGKSTLCAAFAVRGARVLADDCVIVRRSGNRGIEVSASYPGLRLFPQTRDLLGLCSEGTAPVSHYTDKRRFAVPFEQGPVPLQALFVLAEEGPAAHGSAVEVLPVRGRAAFLVLLRSLFQLHLDDRCRSSELFKQVAAVADELPIHRLRCPRDLTRLPAVCAAILRAAAARPSDPPHLRDRHDVVPIHQHEPVVAEEPQELVRGGVEEVRYSEPERPRCCEE